MENPLNCTWQEYKQRAVEFFQSAPDLDSNELNNAFKCLTLSYINLTEPAWKQSAAVVMELATKSFIERESTLRERGVNEYPPE